MSPAVVRSPRNRGVSDAMALHRAKERRARRQTLAEGPHLFSSICDTAPEAIDLVFAISKDVTTLDRCEAAGLAVVEVTEDVMARLAPSIHPRGPVVVLEIPPPSRRVNGPVVVLVGISDPGNLGTLIRSAAAMGFSVAVTPGSADPWAPKVLRAGAGGHFSVAISALGEPLESLRRDGFTVVASVPRNGTWPPPAADGFTALLVGNEGDGLPGEFIAASDARVTIPMRPGVESLNAAMAGTIVMYEMARGSRP